MAKVMRKEAWHTQRRDPASGNPLFPCSRASTPKPECFTGGLSPITISLGEGVNLQLQGNKIKIPGRDKSVSTFNSSEGDLACLYRFVQPHVIVYSLPTVRGTRCVRLTKGKFFGEVRHEEYSGLARDYIGEGFFFVCGVNHCCSFPALGGTRVSQVTPLC